ncbi:MAG: hypothetical protein AAFY88_07510 [Acidobacteriota bacterium]
MDHREMALAPEFEKKLLVSRKICQVEATVSPTDGSNIQARSPDGVDSRGLQTSIDKDLDAGDGFSRRIHNSAIERKTALKANALEEKEWVRIGWIDGYNRAGEARGMDGKRTVISIDVQKAELAVLPGDCFGIPQKDMGASHRPLRGAV